LAAELREAAGREATFVTGQALVSRWQLVLLLVSQLE
jgi:hypothetical protein